jgi:peptidoglycan/LPS O-acetylase OafA/YrhL
MHLRLWRILLMVKRKTVTAAIVAIVGIAFVGWAMHLSNSQDMLGKTRGLAIVKIPKQLPENLVPIGDLVIENYKEYRSNAVRWSFVHFGTLMGAAFLSAAAGVILKFQSILTDESKRNDTAAVCAAAGALLITVSGIGEFESKWRTNRIAALEMENLSYELLNNPDESRVIERITEINKDRLRGIVSPGVNERSASQDKEID